jgi:hypothetical protein
MDMSVRPCQQTRFLLASMSMTDMSVAQNLELETVVRPISLGTRQEEVSAHRVGS